VASSPRRVTDEFNEFLKEHLTVQELAGEIQGQKSAVAELKATVEKQEAIIAQQQKGIEVHTGSSKEQAQLSISTGS
jgi:hypothetical protein